MCKKNVVWLKPVSFLIGLALLFSLIQLPFTTLDRRIYQTVKGFYDEEPGSLDAVYIGASNVYASWQGPVGWSEYGIACYSFAIPAMPPRATMLMIEECRKTQPDALFIVNLNNYKQDGLEVSVSDVHNVTNFLPMSGTKVKLINELAEAAGFTGMDKAEFFLPFIRFHSTWNQLHTAKFDKHLATLKGASSYSNFLGAAENVEHEFSYSDKRFPLTEEQEQSLSDLVEYCQDENVKMLFVFSPQAISDVREVEQINTMKDYVVAQGFPILDMMEDIDSLEMDFASDFYNAMHCNIHGSLKFTYALGSYLMENYGFRDKRGDPAYASWDRAAEDYTEIIEFNTLDFERENVLRSNDLAAPKLSECEVYGERIRVRWNASAGASGYAIYRQNKSTPWQLITTVDANTLGYTDEQLERNVTYTYTVVPFYTDGEKTVYGNFNIEGVFARTVMPAPTLLSWSESDDGFTISWESLPDADGYSVFRTLGDQAAVNLGTLDADVTTFTDNSYLPNLPYVYTVKAFELTGEEPQYGDCDRTGFLLYADLPCPEPAVRKIDSGLEISWPAIKGASCYSVYAQDADLQWHAIASHTTDTVCVDRGILADTYKVVAELKHGSKYYEFPSAPITFEKGDN